MCKVMKRFFTFLFCFIQVQAIDVDSDVSLQTQLIMALRSYDTVGATNNSPDIVLTEDIELSDALTLSGVTTLVPSNLVPPAVPVLVPIGSFVSFEEDSGATPANVMIRSMQGSYTIDGGSRYRGFTIRGGTANISNLTLKNLSSIGGTGSLGGAGGGFGGAILFTGSTTTNIEDVSFIGCSAIGGMINRQASYQGGASLNVPSMGFGGSGIYSFSTDNPPQQSLGGGGLSSNADGHAGGSDFQGNDSGGSVDFFTVDSNGYIVAESGERTITVTRTDANYCSGKYKWRRSWSRSG